MLPSQGDQNDGFSALDFQNDGDNDEAIPLQREEHASAKLHAATDFHLNRLQKLAFNIIAEHSGGNMLSEQLCLFVTGPACPSWARPHHW